MELSGLEGEKGRAIKIDWRLYSYSRLMIISEVATDHPASQERFLIVWFGERKYEE